MTTSTMKTQQTSRCGGDDLCYSRLQRSFKRTTAMGLQVFFQALAFCSLVGLGGISMPAYAGEVISIGQADSPVLSKVAKKRARKEARTLIKAMRQEMKAEITAMKDEMKAEIKKLPKNQRKAARMQGKIERKAARKQKRAEIKALRQQLKASNVDAVIANLSNVNPTEDDMELVTAALEEGVPVVLEKVSKDKMATMLGLGIDADMVVAESRKGGGQVRLNIWNDQMDQVSDGQSETLSIPYTGTPEELEKMVAEAKKEKLRLPPNPKGKSVKAPDYRGYGQASEQVENILVHRPYSKAA